MARQSLSIVYHKSMSVIAIDILHNYVRSMVIAQNIIMLLSVEYFSSCWREDNLPNDLIIIHNIRYSSVTSATVSWHYRPRPASLFHGVRVDVASLSTWHYFAGCLSCVDVALFHGVCVDVA